jgi:hypothetical protein
MMNEVEQQSNPLHPLQDCILLSQTNMFLLFFIQFHFAGSHTEHHSKFGCKSISTSAQYVTPDSKIYSKKSKMCHFSSEN